LLLFFFCFGGGVGGFGVCGGGCIDGQRGEAEFLQ